jgi:hypothetical protein
VTGLEVQALKEAEDARIWEELNAPDPYEKQMRDAALEMKQAIDQIDKAENFLVDAIAALNETPMEDRVASLLDALEDLHCDIKYLQEKYGKGERE